MRAYFLVCLFLLAFLHAESLPKWAKECVVVAKKDRVLACGEGMIMSGNIDYALDLAKTNATDKILSFLHDNVSNATMEVNAKSVKTSYIGAKKVYVLLEIKKSLIKNVKDKGE
ncbi:hypothetical protein [Helicobacter cetorum]|uniref:hypothetical protein n=1 Tax=Helicobacter cetorum TaxID=138563 RepID=UPI000CF0E4E8|nr:hypothetical protein [Helicobacter cetorum]